MDIYNNIYSKMFWVVNGDALDEATSREEIPWEDLYALEEVEFSYEDSLGWVVKHNLKDFLKKFGYARFS